MSDQTATLAALQGSLKEDYLGVLNDQFPTGAVLDESIGNNTKDIEGLEGVMSIALNPNLGVGYADEDGYIPDAGYPTIKKIRLSLAYLYGSLQISGQLMKMSRSEKGAWAPALTTLMEDLMKGLKKLRNAYNFGDGSGVIARVTAVAGSGVTLTVDRWSPLFEDPRALDSFNLKGASGVKAMSAVNISTGNRTNRTLTMAATSTVAVGDYLYLKGSRNNVQMGLLGAIDNQTFVGTFQGLDRSAYPRWNSYVFNNGGVARNISEGLILGAMGAARMQDAVIDLWMMSPFCLNDLIEELQVLRQFVNIKKYSAANRAIDLGGFAATEDPDCIPGYAFGLTKEDFSFYSAGGLEWMKEPGAGNILQRVITSGGRKDAYEATLYMYRQLGVKRCNRSVRLEDLAENTPTGY